MYPVSVPPVITNNLQTSLSVHLSIYIDLRTCAYSMGVSQYKTSRTTIKATSTQEPCLSGTAQGQESVY